MLGRLGLRWLQSCLWSPPGDDGQFMTETLWRKCVSVFCVLFQTCEMFLKVFRQNLKMSWNDETQTPTCQPTATLHYFINVFKPFPEVVWSNQLFVFPPSSIIYAPSPWAAVMIYQFGLSCQNMYPWFDLLNAPCLFVQMSLATHSFHSSFFSFLSSIHFRCSSCSFSVGKESSGFRNGTCLCLIRRRRRSPGSWCRRSWLGNPKCAAFWNGET